MILQILISDILKAEAECLRAHYNLIWTSH